MSVGRLVGRARTALPCDGSVHVHSELARCTCRFGFRGGQEKWRTCSVGLRGLRASGSGGAGPTEASHVNLLRVGACAVCGKLDMQLVRSLSVQAAGSRLATRFTRVRACLGGALRAVCGARDV